MKSDPFQALWRACHACGFDSLWMKRLCARASENLSQCNHGDLPRWREALARLPTSEPFAQLDEAMPRFGVAHGDQRIVFDALMELHPWRKGPLEIAGVVIDTEWRSDLKWSRIAPHVNLEGNRVLDIGSGNGYFGWRMLAAGARLVVGIDPTWVFVMQWLACRHFAGDLPNFVLPLGIEHLPPGGADFGAVFSMGVLYHRRDPLGHLRQLHGLLEAGGSLVLETLVLPDTQADEVLRPEDRYARMRNVWAVPGCERLLDWIVDAGFREPQIVDVSWTTPAEQRSTSWMTFESLEDGLDPQNPRLTVEGYPAPKRAMVIATR